MQVGSRIDVSGMSLPSGRVPFDAFARGHVSRLLLTLYAVLIIAMLALFVAAAWYLTLEMDEAWILLSTANVAGIPLPPTTALAHPVLTTGGLHLLLYALAMQGTTDIFVLRLISVIASALLLFVVYRILRRRGHPAARAAAGTVLFCAVPGFVLQAGMAMGEILATAALLPGLMICMRGPAESYRNAIGGGLLLGLACATRIGCLPVLAGLLACALIFPSDRRSRLTQAGIAVGLAA